ncbi:MAG: TRAP transporter small permease subunit [Pseudomonadota bacterium]|jgi:TRAP-type mannitol/chloroaromatic compound transport system permease small subunit|nr:TRAP transporter small permease subunit [Pseudomonadota bacterium]|tara:strand:- start:10 stop:501 length:492 start_codon:yes stop_codon:yes gene_type:complete
MALLDRISSATGRAASWLTLLMVVGTFVIVLLRYALDSGVVWLQEAVTWMHAMVFMLGAAYTLQRDEHVRVDIFYREMNRQKQALVNLFGIVLFVVPVCLFFVLESYEYVQISWSIREVSRDSGGLPYPFIPILKSLLIVMPITVLLQSASLTLHSIVQLRKQ